MIAPLPVGTPPGDVTIPCWLSALPWDESPANKVACRLETLSGRPGGELYSGRQAYCNHLKETSAPRGLLMASRGFLAPPTYTTISNLTGESGWAR